MIAPCSPKGREQLTREWDTLASERHAQISSGEDLSFHHVLVPLLLELLTSADQTTLLDVGAGTGHVTQRIAGNAKAVLAIEPSSASLGIAETLCDGLANVRFIAGWFEDFTDQIRAAGVTTAVAAMTLMTVPELQRFAAAMADVLSAGSRLVATLTHPCFWPRYWGYDTQSWFAYGRETFIEGPFAISTRSTSVVTTHVHRPLHAYLGAFAAEGFCLEEMLEPMPSPAVQALYPQRWAFPRFLGLRWRKERR